MVSVGEPHPEAASTTTATIILRRVMMRMVMVMMIIHEDGDHEGGGGTQKVQRQPLDPDRDCLAALAASLWNSC